MPTPEEMARQIIDQRLVQAGWLVQDKARMNLGAGLEVAVREYQLPAGPCDYLLFVDRRAAGVIEAKPEGRCQCRLNFPEKCRTKNPWLAGCR